MSNDLVLQGARPSYLPAPAASAAENPFLSGLAGGGSALASLSFRGKEFSIRRGDEELALPTPLPVLLLGSRVNVSKRYYDKSYTPGETSVPRCWADDGKNPQADGQPPVAPTCAQCPMNVFGTSKRQDGTAGAGKACRDYRRVVVYPLVEIEGAGLHEALILDIPPTSFKAKKGEPTAYREMVQTLAQNAAFIQAGERTLSAAVTELSFMRGTESPRLVWAVTGWATPEQLTGAIELAQSDDVAEVLNVAAPVAPVAALSGPAPQPAPVAETPKVNPAPQLVETPKAEPAPQVVAPVAEAPASQDPAALMAQLQTLLGKKA